MTMASSSTVALYVTVSLCFGATVTLLVLPNYFSDTWRNSGHALVDIRIDGLSRLRNVSGFWKNTGFCPPLPHEEAANWFLSEDMVQNLRYIGALPYTGIEHVRIHWLLDTVKYSGFKDGEVPTFNFNQLDRVMALLWLNGLHPGFEVMGNPSNVFTDFENATQVYMWRCLVSDLLHRYTEQYGIDELLAWKFESWNEPSLHHFDRLNFTLQGFYNYYDATADAIKSHDARLKIGGPGGSLHDYDVTSYSWGLLNHVVHGTNYITKRKGSPIDYISIHKKGLEPNNTAVVFDKETQFYTSLEKNLPELTRLPVYNDEADPLVGWSQEKWWRADVTYAAMVTKIITEHQNRWMGSNRSLKFTLLSNDNGFLSYNPHFFTQRTLLARFQMNNTKPPHVQFIRKPVYGVMALLGFLGENQLNTYTESTETQRNVGVLATSHTGDLSSPQDSGQYAVIVYNSADTEKVTSETNVTVQLQNIQTTPNMKVVIYQLDNNHGNPHAVWLQEGQPETPSADVLRKMRENEEPVRVLGPSCLPTLGGGYFVNVTLPLPGVLLLHMCERAQSGPGQVTNVSVHHITTGYMLITWSDMAVKTKCVRTYEVERSVDGSAYQRVNQRDTIFNSFVLVTSESGRQSSLFRVRAVDYWDRTGPYSHSVHSQL